MFFAALFAVTERNTITGGLAGVALTYAMQVSSKCFWYSFCTITNGGDIGFAEGEAPTS